MPTYERRYFLSLLTKDLHERKEHADSIKNTKSSKGNRSNTISGDALKSKIKSGEIPNR